MNKNIQSTNEIKKCPECNQPADYYTASDDELSIEEITCRHCNFHDYTIN